MDQGLIGISQNTHSMDQILFFAQNIGSKLISQNGFLYNGYAISNVEFPPFGWRVASYFDFLRLIMNTYPSTGGKIKETGTRNWESPNTGATDSYAFSMLPNGYRFETGEFGYFRFNGLLWALGRESGTAYPNSFVRTDYNSDSLFSSDGGGANKLGLGVRMAREQLETGCLYNFYAASSSRNLAPSGCHVPTNSEWQTLRTYLGGTSYGYMLKEEGASSVGVGRWASPNTGATNSKRLSIIGEGWRNSGGEFGNWRTGAYLWTKSSYNTSKAYSVNLGYNHGNIYMYENINYFYKVSGMSVRCIVDDDTYIGPLYDSVNGEIYDTVRIGTQVWLASNLRSTKYRDGTSIPNVTDNSTWAGLTSGAYCWYGNAKAETSQPSYLVDHNGNQYGVIQIGKELWTSKNHACTENGDGSTIYNEQSNAGWAARTSPAYCSYNNLPFS